jgi:hypothetical protein
MVLLWCNGDSSCIKLPNIHGQASMDADRILSEKCEQNSTIQKYTYHCTGFKSSFYRARNVSKAQLRLS